MVADPVEAFNLLLQRLDRIAEALERLARDTRPASSYFKRPR